MGGNHSKKTFSEWDLIEFSNLTGVPLKTVETIYGEFKNIRGINSKIDEKQFRHLYKQMYINQQSDNTTVAPFLSDEDLNRMSDHVFQTYDFDGSGKLSFEEFAEIYLMLNHYSGPSINGHTRRDRFNYLLDQYDLTPGFITREHGEQVFNRLDQFPNWSTWNQSHHHPLKSNVTTKTNWEDHWKKLDDGSGRVSKEKFVEYVTNSNEYKTHFHPSTV